MAADETAADRKRPRVADDAALPRNTKIRVVGNGRTKDSLIGTEAVVIKAIGLGGWHWLALETGETMRLQRNALTVISYPEKGASADENEEEGGSDGEDAAPTNGRSPMTDVVTNGRHGQRLPRRAAKEAARAANGDEGPSTSTRRPREAAKRSIAQEKGAGAGTSGPRRKRVDFNKLDTESLRRYRTAFKLDVARNSPKVELVDAVSQHFRTLPAVSDDDEAAVLTAFCVALATK